MSDSENIPDPRDPPDHDDPADPSDPADPADPPRTGDTARTDAAANGEGALGPPDAGWAPTGRLLPIRERVAFEAIRIGLAGAVRESLYVADVFCVIQARSLEFYEGLLAELGRGCESHAKLRASYTGTLAGDFIRWCRGLFPGLVARDLAEFMAASGMMLANQFRVEIEETVRRAARNRRIGGETPP